MLIATAIGVLLVEASKHLLGTRTPQLHEPSFVDLSHALVIATTIGFSFGLGLFLWRALSALAEQQLSKLLDAEGNQGKLTRYRFSLYRSFAQVALPLVCLMWLTLEGTKFWQPYFPYWLLLGLATILAAPLLTLVIRALSDKFDAFQDRNRLVASATLLSVGIAAYFIWYKGTTRYEFAYGRLHLVAFAMLLFVFYVLVGTALRGRPPIESRGAKVVLIVALVTALSPIVLGSPSKATLEFLYTTLPTRWLLLSGAFTVDEDGDGVVGNLGVFLGGDCDDFDAERYPDHTEIVGNGHDENCFAGDQLIETEHFFPTAPYQYDASAPTLNVVVLSIDGFRYDHFAGPAAAEIPVLHELGGESLNFSNYRSCAPHTRLSLSDLLSGTVVHHDLSERAPTALDSMTEAGVATVGLENGWDVATEVMDGWADNPRAGAYHDLAGDRAVSELLINEFLLADPPEPFFTFLHFMTTHPPMDYFHNCPEEEDVWEQKRCVLAYLDPYIGDVIEAIKTAGLWERTVLVIVSDHGDLLNDKELPRHDLRCLDQLLRTPLLIRIPGEPGREVPEPASCFDFMATLAGVANLPISTPLLGQDFTRPDVDPNRAQYARTHYSGRRDSWQPPQYTVVYEDFKLVFDVVAGITTYFDLINDPEEQHPLLSIDPELEEELVQRMEAWLSLLAGVEGL